jgi:RecA/RadA recombinase
MKKAKTTPAGRTLPKSATGIRGLDEITGGGLPKGRPTLICGGAGCGKTLLSMALCLEPEQRSRQQTGRAIRVIIDAIEMEFFKVPSALSFSCAAAA